MIISIKPDPDHGEAHRLLIQIIPSSMLDWVDIAPQGLREKHPGGLQQESTST